MIKSSRGKGRSKAKAREEDRAQEFVDALKDLSESKGIAEDVLFDAIETALRTAYQRDYGAEQNVRITLDRTNGAFHVLADKIVTEVVDDPATQISLAEAKKLSSDYQLDDRIAVDVTPASFGRIAAQNAKQVVVQRIREAERGIIYDEFSSREKDIITGMVERVENKNVYIDLGRTGAVLTPTEQIPGESYHYGDKIKAYIIEVKRNPKGPQIVVSRTHPDLLKRLFELEVPEIHDGIVEIRSVAREPGMRSKIAVFSNDPDVDPVGSCVGPKGLRVQAVVDELKDEKIDIVKWNEDPVKFIANALSPAEVISVAVNTEEKFSRVIVPDRHLSLAIGKEGQNARLAAKLTGWKIDIKSETQAAEEPDDDMDVMEVTGEEAFSSEVE